MPHPYQIFDVFTDTVLTGNPLAVVFDADGLSHERMQAIAAEFNLSETICLMAPRDPAHTAAARLFTPKEEMPFAGHPTIGSAVVLAATGAIELAGTEAHIVLEEASGPVPVTIRSEDGRPGLSDLQVLARRKTAPDARQGRCVTRRHRHVRQPDRMRGGAER